MPFLGGMASSFLFLRGSRDGETHSIPKGLEEKRRAVDGALFHVVDGACQAYYHLILLSLCTLKNFFFRAAYVE